MELEALSNIPFQGGEPNANSSSRATKTHGETAALLRRGFETNKPFHLIGKPKTIYLNILLSREAFKHLKLNQIGYQFTSYVNSQAANNKMGALSMYQATIQMLADDHPLSHESVIPILASVNDFFKETEYSALPTVM